MKHYGSKLLALLLCMMTVLGMMPMTVSADSGTAAVSGQLTVENAGDSFVQDIPSDDRIGNQVNDRRNPSGRLQNRRGNQEDCAQDDSQEHFLLFCHPNCGNPKSLQEYHSHK